MRNVDGCRDVLLACHTNKPFSRVQRFQLNPMMKALAAPTQMGSGINRGACDFLHLCVRALVDIAQLRSISEIIFVYLSTAFASVHRSMIAARLGTEEERMARQHRLPNASGRTRYACHRIL